MTDLEVADDEYEAGLDKSGETRFLIADDPEQQPPPPVVADSEQGRRPIVVSGGFPSAFRTPATVCCVGMMLWALLLVFYFGYVFSYLVFTQTAPTASFTGLAITNVPFYALSPTISASTSEVYHSFDYFLWMTDYLLLLMPPYVIGVLFFSVINQMRAVGVLGIGIVGFILGLWQFGKAVYWTLIVFNVSTSLSCAAYQFCLSHNPGEPVGTSTSQFITALIFAYVNSLICFLLLTIPGIVRSGRLATLMISGKFGGSANRPGARGGGGGGNSATTVNDEARQMSTGTNMFGQHGTGMQRRAGGGGGGGASTRSLKDRGNPPARAVPARGLTGF